jgi:uncharacterized protein (DUF1015 family)
VATIRPFKGMRYDPEKVGDVAAVLCPPYDVISEVARDALYARHPNNYVRLEYAREMPGDDAVENKFSRSARTLEEWLAGGVLQAESDPAIYVHDHYFRFWGREYRRRGIIVRLRLEEWERMIVRPHEDTFAGPKSERLRLMNVTDADISPIMSLFEDENGRIAALLEAVAAADPVLETGWEDDERHRLWTVTETAAQDALAAAFADRPVYIADGHHRYESALNYRREQLARQPDAPEDAAFNFVMMTLIDFEDAGLVVLPPHRLVRGLDASRLAALPVGLASFFEIEVWPVADAGTDDRVESFLAAGAAEQDRLVAYGLAPGQVHALKVKDYTQIDRLMPPGRTAAYRRLGVSVIDHLILEHLLGIAREDQEGKLAYDIDRDVVTRAVSGGDYQLALLHSPMRTSVIKDIADATDRMPRKATYFHPKLPSGLVFYRLG